MCKFPEDWEGGSPPRRSSDCVRFKKAAKLRRDGRVAEGARLESVYTARYPGFESLSLRHLFLYTPAESEKYTDASLIRVSLWTPSFRTSMIDKPRLFRAGRGYSCSSALRLFLPSDIDLLPAS